MANGAYRLLKASLSAVLKHVVCIVYLISCCAIGDNAHNIMYNVCVLKGMLGNFGVGHTYSIHVCGVQC